jgi:3-hydroxybutyryl-CoA dehydrogenase
LRKKVLIRILASEGQKAALQKAAPDEAAILWASSFEELTAEPAEAYLDLLFFPSSLRVTSLRKVLPSVIIIHSVVETLASMQLPFARINAWPGFLERPLVECALSSSVNADILKNLSTRLKKQFILLPDTPGFVSARIIAMIINEAFYALEEGVSSRPEIDIAMKTGTNYPYGPFEWAEKIGLRQIHELLTELAKTDLRYQPSALLINEAVNIF